MRRREASPAGVHRDGAGFIRLITAEPSHERLVQRAFEKVRQAGEGMPAVMIRQLDALAKIMADTRDAGQRQILLDQAAMSCGRRPVRARGVGPGRRPAEIRRGSRRG